MTTSLVTTTAAADLATSPARPLDQNPAAVYLATLKPTGRRAMTIQLSNFAKLLTAGAVADPLALNWSAVGYQHIAAARAAMIEAGKSASTVNLAIAAVRGVLKQAWLLGQLDSEAYKLAVQVKAVKSQKLPKGRALAAGELAALLRVCDSTPGGIRDGSIIAITYGAGLRRSEIVALDRADYNADTGGLTIRGGKGDKDRLAYVGAGGAAALADWLNIRGDQAGPLFLPVDKHGNLVAGRRLNSQSILDMFERRAAAAGVQSFSPHDLRRTFISDLLDAGADIVTVQKLAGHANVQTTAKYDRRGEAAKQKAAGLLHVPYQRKTLV